MSKPDFPFLSTPESAPSLLARGEAAAALALRLVGIGTWEVEPGSGGDIDAWPMRWSMEACRLLGLEPTEEPQSRGALRRCIVAEDMKSRDAVADPAWRQRRPYTTEYRVLRPDGALRNIVEQAHVFSDPVDGTERIFGILQDITDRRQADQALRGYNQLLRGITRAQSRLIAGRPRQETFGELLTSLLNYTGSEFGFIGERLGVFERAEQLQLCATAGTGWDLPIRDYYAGHEQSRITLGDWAGVLGLKDGPFICNTPDPADGTSDLLPGHPPVLNYMLIPFAHDYGARGVIGLANAPGGYSLRLPSRLDAVLNTCASLIWAYGANERRQQAEAQLVALNAELEQRIRQRTAELEAANGELESFSYSVSHDLRAPLRGIDGWSLALIEDYGPGLPDQARGYLRQVREEVQQMGRLIEDLLEMSRVTRVDLATQPIDLTAMAAEIVAGLRRQYPGREVEFTLATGLQGRGDPGLLRVALQNLLDNAWKFTAGRTPARVEFGVRATLNETVYFVADNGAGFDINYAGKLFSPFRRLHRPSEFPGTGVGLATVQRIVRRHGGKICAESAPGEGATFFFTLGSGA